jgi:diamine N-acetyltransferase
MWGIDPEDESFWIGGPIVARQHQRRGYGRAVVAQLLERAASDGYREAALSYDHESKLAQSLYASMGFVETAELVDNETVARRQLR